MDWLGSALYFPFYEYCVLYYAHSKIIVNYKGGVRIMKIQYSILFVWVASVSVCADIKTVIEPILVQARHLAFEHMQDRAKPIPILAIAGCSAVGKSYFAHLVFEALRDQGVNVFVLHQDDYLNLERIFGGFKIHPNLDHDSMHEFLSANRKGIKKIFKPCLVDKCYMKNKMLNFERVDLIIFEGIYSLTGPETYDFGQYCSLGVFLDAQSSDIVKWHSLRNKKRPFFKRLSRDDIAEHATCLLYEYTRFILPSKKNAQFVVYKEDLNSYRLIVNHPSTI